MHEVILPLTCVLTFSVWKCVCSILLLRLLKGHILMPDKGFCSPLWSHPPVLWLRGSSSVSANIKNNNSQHVPLLWAEPWGAHADICYMFSGCTHRADIQVIQCQYPLSFPASIQEWESRNVLMSAGAIWFMLLLSLFSSLLRCSHQSLSTTVLLSPNSCACQTHVYNKHSWHTRTDSCYPLFPPLWPT